MSKNLGKRLFKLLYRLFKCIVLNRVIALNSNLRENKNRMAFLFEKLYIKNWKKEKKEIILLISNAKVEPIVYTIGASSK
jgi:hypothetical protein